MKLSIFILLVSLLFLVRAGNTEESKGLGIYYPSKIPAQIYRLVTFIAKIIISSLEVIKLELLPHVLAAVMPAISTQVGNNFTIQTVSETGLTLGFEWVE